MAKVKILLGLLLLLSVDYYFFVQDVQLDEVSDAVIALANCNPDAMQKIVIPLIGSEDNISNSSNPLKVSLSDAASVVKERVPKLLNRVCHPMAPWNISSLIPNSKFRLRSEGIAHQSVLPDDPAKIVAEEDLNVEIARPVSRIGTMITAIGQSLTDTAILIRTVVVGITLVLVLVLEGALMMLP